MKSIAVVKQQVALAVKFILSKNALSVLLPIVVFILFNNSFEKLISKTIVEYGLSKVQHSYPNDIIFISIAIIGIAYAFSRPSGYLISKPASILGIFICLAYIYYRNFAKVWEFTHAELSRNIFYFDLLIIWLLILLTFFIISITSKANALQKPIGEYLLFDDEPLGDYKPDELGYTKYSEGIAEKIKRNSFSKSFAIGITGKWGSGKTSFIDLIKRKLKEENHIVLVDFQPWNSSTSKSIIKDFFDTAQSAVAPFYSPLSNLLASYSKKLLALSDSSETKTTNSIIKLFTNDESISSLFEEINDSIKKINKKFVFFIDDLDRLDKEEIIEVIRLIRNTANFYNTYFVAAYDKDYVTNALSAQNSHETRLFLEKIFQAEVNLPNNSSDRLINRLELQLKSFIPKQYHNELHLVLFGQTFNPGIPANWLQTMRDVTRFSNALQLNIRHLLGETSLKDLIKIELLRLKFQNVYELLGKHSDRFLAASNKSDIYAYRLVESNKGDAYKSALHKYLVENKDKLLIDTEDINKAMGLINSIFEPDMWHVVTSNLSIVHPSKFGRYFTYVIGEDNLSEIEFSKARLAGVDEFKQKISNWVSQGLAGELQAKFHSISAYDNRKDFENIVNGIVHLSHLMYSKANTNRFVAYTEKDLLDKLTNYDNRLVIKYYSTDKNEIERGGLEFKNFVRNIFNSAPLPYSFESSLARIVSYDKIESNFPLSQEEIDFFTLNYLSKYCEHNQKFDGNVWLLYHNCKKTVWIKDGYNSYARTEVQQEAANDVIRELAIRHDLCGYLVSTIRREGLDDGRFSIANATAGIFGSWEKLEHQLFEAKNSDCECLAEFKDFYLRFKEAGASQSVEYEFKSINLS